MTASPLQRPCVVIIASVDHSTCALSSQLCTCTYSPFQTHGFFRRKYKMRSRQAWISGKTIYGKTLPIKPIRYSDHHVCGLENGLEPVWAGSGPGRSGCGSPTPPWASKPTALASLTNHYHVPPQVPRTSPSSLRLRRCSSSTVVQPVRPLRLHRRPQSVRFMSALP